MNEFVKKMFPEMVANKDSGKCPTCGKDVTMLDFKDQLSVREFKISGMCQKCQDETFG